MAEVKNCSSYKWWRFPRDERGACARAVCIMVLKYMEFSVVTKDFWRTTSSKWIFARRGYYSARRHNPSFRPL